MIVCPLCHGSLVEENNSLTCQGCARSYGKDRDVFFDLVTDAAANEKAATTHEYAEDQSLDQRPTLDKLLQALVVSTTI
jgi:uncharacterized protein YbaR (Trm112 family)